MKARLIRLHHKVLGKLIRLKKEADEAGEYRVAKRIHATLMNHDGKSSGEIRFFRELYRRSPPPLYQRGVRGG